MILIFRCETCGHPYLTRYQDEADRLQVHEPCGGRWRFECRMPWGDVPTPGQRAAVNEHLRLTKPGAPVH